MKERRSHGENVGQTLHSRLRKGLKIKIGVTFMQSGGGGRWVAGQVSRSINIDARRDVLASEGCKTSSEITQLCSDVDVV